MCNKIKQRSYEEQKDLIHITAHITHNYPEVLYFCDLAGLNLPEKTAVLVYRLRSNRGFPDLNILHPNDKYSALFIEYKKTGTNIFKKNGDYVSEHLREQSEVLIRLNSLGFYACFGIGPEPTCKLIDSYMNNLLD